MTYISTGHILIVSVSLGVPKGLLVLILKASSTAILSSVMNDDVYVIVSSIYVQFKYSFYFSLCL
jgi:hypothetical protein